MDSNFPDVVLRPGGGRRCRVLFSYSPQNDDELQLEVNDEIDFLEEVENGWWKGRLGNKIGVFPSNFVCEVKLDESGHNEGVISAPLSSPDSTPTFDDAPLLPPKPIKEQCRVLFAYDAANDDELTLKKDDVITIITKEVEDKGWWKGELRGKVGLFPDNFVELLTPPEEITQNQQKKPDRPSKSFDKIDAKSPLVALPAFQKILQDNSNHKEAEDQIAGLKNEGPFSKKNAHNLDRAKPESPPTKFGDKTSFNLFPTKASDTTTSHRKSLDVKPPQENHPPAIVPKKPAFPPPVSNKPKPPAAKPGHVKRLSDEMNDFIESTANKFPPNQLAKKITTELHDFLDGSVTSKTLRLPEGNGKEDFDLDLVERTDMLTHITSSRPRPPGRRLPTKDAKETRPNTPLTNGNLEANDKEKNQREREWEKHKPPWVNELKLNLKSNKTSPSDSKLEKKSPYSGQVKSATQSPVESPSSNATLSEAAATGAGGMTSHVTVRQSNAQSMGPRVQSMFESGSKVSELSSKFSPGDKLKQMSPPKGSEVQWNSVGEQTPDEVVSRKEFLELKLKVDRLAKVITELTSQLCDEVEKRKLLEKELNKLTDLVTQV